MNMIHLSRAEYNTLSTIGTLTKGGVTYTFDPLNNEYIVPTTTKYLHNVTLHKSGADSYYVDASFQIVNDSPDAIDTTVKLFNAIKGQIPTVNMWYPCNILYTSVTAYSESAALIYYNPTNDRFDYTFGAASHAFLDSHGSVYRATAGIGGGAPRVADIVTEL